MELSTSEPRLRSPSSLIDLSLEILTPSRFRLLQTNPSPRTGGVGVAVKEFGRGTGRVEGGVQVAKKVPREVARGES